MSKNRYELNIAAPTVYGNHVHFAKLVMENVGEEEAKFRANLVMEALKASTGPNFKFSLRVWAEHGVEVAL